MINMSDLSNERIRATMETLKAIFRRHAPEWPFDTKNENDSLYQVMTDYRRFEAELARRREAAESEKPS